jgi:AraC-like DNA-binding protein
MRGAGQTDLHLWTHAGLTGVKLFRAEQFRQRFARHSHDEYALGVITGGVLGFDYRGERLRAGSGEINVVVPGEAHTGHPALGESWSYRMFYIEPALMQDIARQLGRDDAQLPFFRAGVIADRPLAARVLRLHQDLESQHVCALEVQSRLTVLLAAWTRRHGARTRTAVEDFGGVPNVSAVRDFLNDCWQQKPTLRQLAQMVELSPYQLLRAFSRRHGLPPHAYLIQRQVREAQRLIERGAPIADAAGGAGFADQSHLNRHFKRICGVTPGQYRNFVQASRGPRR